MTLDPAYAAAERTAAAQHLIARAQAEIIARWTISPPPQMPTRYLVMPVVNSSVAPSRRRGY